MMDVCICVDYGIRCRLCRCIMISSIVIGLAGNPSFDYEIYKYSLVADDEQLRAELLCLWSVGTMDLTQSCTIHFKTVLTCREKLLRQHRGLLINCADCKTLFGNSMLFRCLCVCVCCDTIGSLKIIDSAMRFPTYIALKQNKY